MARSISVPPEIPELVERFGEHIDEYRNGHYNETQVRREYIDPLFIALGWDVNNTRGYAEAYKDVIHEDAIKIGGVTKAPDYCFRIGGVRKFFVEAKKPSVDVKHDVHPAYQLRRYAWSAKLPLSILTDFEELAVYDTRVCPKRLDKASAGRVNYLGYQEYADRWGEIAGVFHRDAILKGSFDKYAQDTRRKRGTAEVDAEFLKEIESWREALARNIALRNAGLTDRELNFAVQRTIDRVIFLRMCEDRGIERYAALQDLLNGAAVYERLMALFRQADDRYNSGLFHFQREKGRTEPPDELTPELSIDDKVLKDIFKRLYYPESPYEFSVLPADILGQVYEQFLGQVIVRGKRGRARVEAKPEVKKAGGVYYTPTYIVDYIVENTVGKLLEGKDPKTAAKLRICDPACGSGSFLIGAYQYLLDWHLRWYLDHDPEKLGAGRRPPIYCRPRGGQAWALTVAERKRVLLNNIYGVDIDPQAVEVTKLSLLLKVLEGETTETIGQTFRLFHERALPDLAANIQCGNSLIGPDFYDDPENLKLPAEEQFRINAFDWENAFSEVFKGNNLGFDAVIGNPPYVDIKALPDKDVRYVFKRFETANNRINLFAAFLERALKLGRGSGSRVSLIIPTAFLAQSSYRKLRELILSRYGVCAVARLPNESFGSSAGEIKVDTVIVALGDRGAEPDGAVVVGYAGYERITAIDGGTARVCGRIRQERWQQAQDSVWSLNTTDEDEAVLEKCASAALKLDECVDFCLGLTPYDKHKGHTDAQIKGRVYHADHRKDDSYKPLLAGNDVRRYVIKWNGQQWISYGPWLGAPREQRFFTEKRILVKQIIDWTSQRIWAAMCEEELYNTQNAFNLLQKGGLCLEYVLGILNSRLMSFYHRKRCLDEFKMRFQKILIRDCRRFPIPAVDFRDAREKYRYERISSLVGTMPGLQEAMENARTPEERSVLGHRIATVDKQLDGLIYELYGLTDEEIGVVEGDSK